MRCSRLAGSILFGMLLTASPALAGPSLRASRPPAPVFGPDNPLSGWLAFCTTEPAECEINPSEPAIIRLTPEIQALLARVTARVNEAIQPLTDQEHWGEVDRWSFPDAGVGDCEDFQLEKRRLLVAAGIPHRAMRMTVVIDDIGEGHAVLTVRTDRGDLILDNKTNAVLPWQETGYEMVKREGDVPGQWVSLRAPAVPGPALTSNR